MRSVFPQKRSLQKWHSAATKVAISPYPTIAIRPSSGIPHRHHEYPQKPVENQWGIHPRRSYRDQKRGSSPMPSPTIYHSLDLYDQAATIGAVDMRAAMTVDTAVRVESTTGWSTYGHHFWPDVTLMWRQIEHLAHFLDHLEFYCDGILLERARHLANRPSPSPGDLQVVELILKERQFRQSFYSPRFQKR